MREPDGVRYLAWIIALRAGGLRIDLTDSGLRTPLDRLRPEPGEVATTWGGDPEVRARLAARYGVGEESVLPTLGTSFAIWLAVAAAIDPGDEVLVEDPAYEPLAAVPKALGGIVRTFPRRIDAGCAVEPEVVLDRLSPRTRLVMLSDLHNPSGAAADPAVLAALAGELAARGVRLFVDEVYRDFLPGPVGTARRFGENVLVASSLTKVYGLGGLRAGWVLASPDRIDAIRRHLTLLEVHDPAPQIPWVRAALAEADTIRAESLERAARGRAFVEAWAAGQDVITVFPSAGGISAWLRLPEGVSSERLAARLHEKDGIGVVPGSFFGDDGGLRVSTSAAEPVLREGLDRILMRLAEIPLHG